MVDKVVTPKAMISDGKSENRKGTVMKHDKRRVTESDGMITGISKYQCEKKSREI